MATNFPRHVAVTDGGKRQWVVERYSAPEGTAHRYLFHGPLPGKMLFTSSGGPLTNAIADARKQWREMDPERREKWYGAKGVYAKLAEKPEAGK